MDMESVIELFDGYFLYLMLAKIYPGTDLS